MVENLIEIFLNTTPNGLFYKKGNNIKFMAGWSQSISKEFHGYMIPNKATNSGTSLHAINKIVFPPLFSFS